MTEQEPARTAWLKRGACRLLSTCCSVRPHLQVGGFGIEVLAEAHDVEPGLPQRRADRRRGLGLAGLDEELDNVCDYLFFLRHSLLAPCYRASGRPHILALASADTHSRTLPRGGAAPGQVSLLLLGRGS